MRKEQKKQAEDFVVCLGQAHNKIEKFINSRENTAAMGLLEQCQAAAIQLGNLIEQSEGTGFITISYIEQYCEVIYRIYEEINAEGEVSAADVDVRLNNLLNRIESSIQNDIKVQYEVVFLPYKAQMWDSLESVWRAADADPDCNAYVIPIPYYTRNADGIFEVYHYEGDEMPEDVPITYYESYDIAERRPDAIYIHNPYDQTNHVTSIDPRYYAKELKKYTDMLVYIPYYVTSGVMSKAQTLCQVYLKVNYIVIQADICRPYFHKAISQDKLLPLGSPKIDRIIHLSQNPPEPPEAWKARMEGKKVYFYNTSIGGMLEGTENYLKKMMYVFKSFEGREDTCLIWRPHPLLEVTFESMRSDFLPIYYEIKEFFMHHNLGIYDETLDIDKTVVLCDAYIGDEHSSVTALFGVLGKPLFLLNNNIHTLPQEDDWKGEVLNSFCCPGEDDWQIIQGNKLYYAPKHDYHYGYYCSLSEFARDSYYARVFEIKENVYVCPCNAQDILVIGQHKVLRRIPLEHCVEGTGAFVAAWNIGKYIFLVPYQYPAIVRYDTETNRTDYITGCDEILLTNRMEECRPAASCVWGNYLIIVEAEGHRALAIESSTMEVQWVTIQEKHNCGHSCIVPNEDTIWLLPYEGKTVTQWNPQTGETKEYSEFPSELYCVDRNTKLLCDTEPFSWVVTYKNNAILSPNNANMFVVIHLDTGKMEKWDIDFPIDREPKNGYFNVQFQNICLIKCEGVIGEKYRLFDSIEKKLYEINMENREYHEITIEINMEDLKKNECGFCEESEWRPYVACRENAFNSLEDFLNDNITGRLFRKERQLSAYQKIAANMDGTSGEAIYEYISKKIKI